ncbi:TetR family transcriptional regulator [Streptomyces sp. XD-27]|uniref:TetR family transcriptional regulator n=1 Tax=Streptomyces sp. XD-27 TaxID=3062779 RepID=UPI0026F46896|nr:TetR family transcriptional regulator [Streptomyces sp. XD-27]WKX71347.1 TetR family transcriptional regulator [Streptomyces sp. XD-27]
MVRQVRAAQTRHALLIAAAGEFDRNGYAGTSLARVCKSAGVTMGALTFHFPTKGELADAVRAEGDSATQSALWRVAAMPGPGLQSLVDLTLELARLLDSDVTVRAAARLAQERRDPVESGHSAWVPILRSLLARMAGEAGTGSDLEDVELLITYLMAGAEACVRTGVAEGSVEEHLGRLWTLLASTGLPGAFGESRRVPAGSPGRQPSARAPQASARTPQASVRAAKPSVRAAIT